MVKLYAKLIKDGVKTIEDVPVTIRAKVEALLAEGA
jgi:hypothetical protein